MKLSELIEKAKITLELCGDGDNSNGSSGTLLYEDGEDEGYRPLGYSQYGPVWI